jgi:DNA-binding MarR family transcriptional regulator
VNCTQIDVGELVVRLDSSMASMTRSAAIRRLYQRISRSAGAEIERSSYMVLRQLATDGPARISDLAHHHGVEPSTMSRHASAPEESGLVTKRADPADRRVALAEATTRGRGLVTKVETERHRFFTAILSGWDPADAERFVTLIERFNSDITHLLDRP